MTVSIASAEWLGDSALQDLLRIFNQNGEEARIAGGAVRNALLGRPAADIDIATTAEPEEIVLRAVAAGYKTVPTGIVHGTVTVIAGGRPYEVTTLREDVETDGRHAVVRFGRDWEADARRRDFTINGLYALADGTIIDHVGGVADLESRRLRFIGDPEARIREDYLRILRFFRFFAWYGEGRPDPAGLKACARLKAGIASLSAERIWSELKLLLAAPDPSRALLWMRQTSVLTRVVPESERWGIDLVLDLVSAEQARGWLADALLRLEAMIPPRREAVEGLAERLKLSRHETERLGSWVRSSDVHPDIGATEFSRLLYRQGTSGPADRLRLQLAREQAKGNGTAADAHGSLLERLAQWKRPSFPLAGRDLIAIGKEPGMAMGKLLARLEEDWIASAFSLDKEALLARARASQ